MFLTKFFLFLDTEEEPEDYITENREIKGERTRKSARCIQQEIMSNLHNVVGGEGILPETVARVDTTGWLIGNLSICLRHMYYVSMLLPIRSIIGTISKVFI